MWAGLTVGTILIPQGMAYAVLAGVPPQYGLYTALIPIIVYALFASSTKLAIGPVAISSMLVLAGVNKLAPIGSEEYINLVILCGFLIGYLKLLIGSLNLGFIVNFISRPVIAGFISAAAIIIIVSQLGDILGIIIPRMEKLHQSCYYACTHLNETNLINLGISLASIGIILGIKKLSKAIPGALIVVILGIAISYFFNLETYGIKIIKEVPQGLPSIAIPTLSYENVRALLPTVLTVTVINIVECLGIAKSLQSKHKDHVVNPDRELMALGLSKLMGSFFLAIPSSGSFSRSAVNSNMNAKTGISGIVTAVLIAITLLFFTDIFYYLPYAVLAAIILLSVVKLIDYKEAIQLWKTHKIDFMMMISTFVITLLVGIEQGIFSGVMLSLLSVLYKSSKPNLIEIANIKGSSHYRNVDRFDDLDKFPHTIILRFDNQLYFGNADYFKESILDQIEESKFDIKYVILDASQMHDIDSTGIHILSDLILDLKKRNIDLHVCEANGVVRDMLYKSGLMNEKEKHHMTVHNAITEIHFQNPSSDDDVINAMQTNVKE
jgi:SulP family sulfate permease